METPNKFEKILYAIQHLEQKSYKFSYQTSKYFGLRKLEREGIVKEIFGAAQESLVN